MRYLLTVIGFSVALNVSAQEEPKKDYGKLFGGFETNAQWYLNDEPRNIDHPDDPVRSNSYLQLNYNYKKFTAGIQGESYLDKALLNYNPGYEGVGLATWFSRLQD